MERWKELGVVDTIYEEEYENSPSSPSISPSISSPSTPVHSRIESWTLATGRETDVSIYVGGTCFRLHKDPLAKRSGYLKRRLTELSEISLPSSITAETFTLIADFCYGTHVVLTPFNVAALRTASELLEMTARNGKRDDNLKQITEAYFRRIITTNRELTPTVFRSCLRLLPESETAAFLVSRCIEALDTAGQSEELDGCLDDVINLQAEEFEIVAESMQRRCGNHDLLYRIIDHYIKEHSGKMTDEQKAEICNFLDCDKLSPQYLVHAIQNPRLPLRFIVRAMLIEQLNTRRAICTSANHRTRQLEIQAAARRDSTSMTLGSILRRDAAAREAAHLKAEMEATYSRIDSLEKELAGMRMLLKKSEKEKSIMERKLLNKSEKDLDSMMEMVLYEPEGGASVLNSSRSASFHYGSRDAKVQRGQKGSTSCASFRLGSREKSGGSEIAKPSFDGSPRNGKNLKGLISRLKSTLWASKSVPKSRFQSRSNENGSGIMGDGDDEGIVVIDSGAFHRKGNSLQ